MKKTFITLLLMIITISSTSCISCSSCSFKKCQHEYGELITIRNATCESAGLKIKKCSKCSEQVEFIIPATGHNYVGGSCTDCGKSE